MKAQISFEPTGANTATVSINGSDFYFSYKTCIAFRTANTGLVISENQWSVTTGKHLTQIDGGSREAKARRRKASEFNALLAQYVDKY